MITVTEQAVQQVKQAAESSAAKDLPLRIAITQADQGFKYIMGFDEEVKAEDLTFDDSGVTLVLDASSSMLANGMTLDFIEIDGSHEFVFLNPNDPNYVPPTEA